MESPLGGFGSGAQGLQERSDSGGLPLGLSNTQGARGRPRFASSTSSASGGVFRLARNFLEAQRARLRVSVHLGPKPKDAQAAGAFVPRSRPCVLLPAEEAPVGRSLHQPAVPPPHTLLLRRRRGRPDRENEKALLWGRSSEGAADGLLASFAASTEADPRGPAIPP